MTRWTPRTSSSSTTTTTPITTTESSNNSTSAITADKNKVAPEIEKDVLLTNITLAKEDVIEITTTSSTTSSTIPTTTTTEEPERQEKESEEVILVQAVTPKKQRDVVVRAENLKEATRDEKVTAKRDLPFLIQSSPGIVCMNIESHRLICTWAVEIVPDTHLEWITVFYRNNNSYTKVSTC